MTQPPTRHGRSGSPQNERGGSAQDMRGGSPDPPRADAPPGDTGTYAAGRETRRARQRETCRAPNATRRARSRDARRAKWSWKSLFGHTALVALSFVYVLPFAWLVTTSLQPDEERSKAPPAFIPAPAVVAKALDDATGHHVAYDPTVIHYVKGVTRVPVPLFFRNTLLVCTLTVIGTILSSALVAYGFSVLVWRGRDTIFYIMLATMMLPGQVTMIPVFLIWRQFGLIDTFAPLVIPAFLGSPFFIFLFRQFFLTIPRDLIEAARMDGASELRIWAGIVMPLSTPAIATVGLFAFLGAWNDFLGPLIYLADQSRYTLSLGLAMFRTQYGSEYGQMMAVATLMVIPIIVLFFFAQKTFIQGIKTSGMKM